MIIVKEKKKPQILQSRYCKTAWSTDSESIIDFNIIGEIIEENNITITAIISKNNMPCERIFPASLYCWFPLYWAIKICAPMLNPNPIMYIII